MQKEILKSTGEDVKTLYLAYMYSGELNSPVNSSQRRQNFEPTSKSYAKMLLAASSSTFPSAAPRERL